MSSLISEPSFIHGLYDIDDSPPAGNRRSFGLKSSNSSRLESRLEAARTATGPVPSTLRQFDTDVCTVTLPSSSSMKEDSREAGPSNSGRPERKNQASASSCGISPTLKVSITTDESGKRTRVVEGVGCPDLATHRTRGKYREA